MNSQLQSYARDVLKDGLSKCNDAQQHVFKRMYAKGNLDLSIGEVIDNMEDEKLDFAISQVESTLAKSSIIYELIENG